jgi:hypothetical protein
LTFIAELKELIGDHEQKLENLDRRISGLEPSLKAELKELKSPIATPTAVPPVSPSQSLKSLKAAEFPLNEAKSVEGIISYLTRKHGGNVSDKGIVTITSKSVFCNCRLYAVRHLAELDLSDPWSFVCFDSESEPGQWVCWDFKEMRVRPTHYTIMSVCLKSWVVESSLDGVNWTEIDRETDIEGFRTHGWRVGSFGVSNSAECRFIRMTQTDKRYLFDDDILAIAAVEFFGTLLE